MAATNPVLEAGRHRSAGEARYRPRDEWWVDRAVRRPLPEATTQAGIRPVLLIFHTAANPGPAPSLFGFFAGDTSLESHHYVNLAGVDEQYVPHNVKADANRRANRFLRGDEWVGAISVESENHPGGRWSTDPWTDAQLEGLIAIAVHAVLVHGIPAALASGPFGNGIGYHVQWGAPSDWTPVAKECPGRERIRQVLEVIIPETYRRTAGGIYVPPSYEEPDPMADPAVTAQLDRIENHAAAARRAAEAGHGAAMVAVQQATQLAGILAPDGELRRRLRSMHAGGYGELPGHPAGDLRWLDTRLARLRNVIELAHADLAAKLGDDADPAAIEAALGTVLVGALGDRGPNELAAILADLPTADLKALGAAAADELEARTSSSSRTPA